VNSSEWAEVVGWIETRYTKPWPLEMAAAYYRDLTGFDATYVWDALVTYYERGQVFPPNGSQLYAGAAQARRAAAESAKLNPALPATEAHPPSQWLEKLYPDEAVSWTVHIERVHVERNPDGCSNPLCGLCSPRVADADNDAVDGDVGGGE
jgi:hypothetical protein